MTGRIMMACPAIMALTAVSCSSAPQYDRDTVVALLQKESGWTAEEYDRMFEQLRATQQKLQDGGLTDGESEFLLVSNSDMNFYLVEALNDGLLNADTAEAFTAWMHDNN